MTTFVLIPGSFHGPWCWRRVAPRLRHEGHRVHTPALDGPAGMSTTVLDEITEPAVLVGHSSGGMVISQLARRHPDGCAGLVYLSGFLLPPGASPHSLGPDPDSLLPAAVVRDETRRVMRLDPESAVAALYNDCAPDDVAWALRRLRPEPLRGGSGDDEPAAEDPRVERLPRFYISCLRDKALGPARQAAMYDALPPSHVYRLDSGHSPFLSRPGELTALLLEIAGRVDPD